MRQAAGQAARHVATRFGVWTHRLFQLLLLVVIILVVAAGALSWRLSQGPLELDWLARRVVDMANAQGGSTHINIRTALVSWQGMRVGIDSPLELVLHDIVVADPRGQSLRLPRAAVTLAPRPLLFGRIAVRSIDLDGLRARLLRAPDGTMEVDLTSFTEASEPEKPDAGDAANPTDLSDILKRLAAPPGSPGLLGTLRRVRIRDTAITIDDRQLGLAWRAPAVDIELNRADGGGASGRIRLALAVEPPQQSAAVTSRVSLDARLALLPDGGVTLAGDLSAIVPARLARLAPRLAPLSALDAPVTIGGTLSLDPDLSLRAAKVSIGSGAGRLTLGQGTMPVLSARLTAEATRTNASFRLESLQVAGRDDGPATTITATGSAARAAGKIAARLVVNVDKVLFADLPVLWPAGVGGPGTRPWITANITGGTAQNGHVSLALTAAEDLSDGAVTSIEGGMEAHDVTGWWLRPVPPIEHGEVKLSFVDPDTMDIFVSAGRQGGTALTMHDSKIRLTGLAGHDQFMAIDANLAGPLADVLALLHHPKIAILDKRPIPIVDPAGSVQSHLTVNMPLRNTVTFEDVAIHATGKIMRGHLGRIAAGRDIDAANVDVDVNNEGLHIKGNADIAALPSALDVMMDFRPGPPAQVIQKVTVSARVDPPALARFGLDTKGALTGSAGVDVTLTDRRDDSGTLAVHADLQRTGIDGAMLNWHKDVGSPGTADVSLRTSHGKLMAIETLRAEAARLSLAATGDMVAGAPSAVHIQRLVVGDGTNVSGDVAMPARPGQAYRVRLSGPSVDLTGALDRRSQPKADAEKTDQRDSPFSVDARIERVVLGIGRQLTGVAAQLEHDGLTTTSGRIEARAGGGAVLLTLAPTPGGRKLTGDAQDAGALLRAFDVMPDMRGGHLMLNALYDDKITSRPLSGTAEIDDFRIQNAPAIGRLLQAMSLYGLVEVASGPGLGFDRLIAPFSLDNQVLTLADARAYSASLGMTAKGRIDLRRQSVAIEGTIVPAYFFNTLLGRAPLVGRLFSPEKDGGLFAASYSINGPFADPSVGVNPLSALTPGFLRGFFDIFDSPSPNRPPAKNQGESQR